MTRTQAPRPLAGIRVISLAEQFPGPYATLLLGDLGADVIQVERPGTGDPTRAFPDFHAALNRGKRSVCLDLKDPAHVAMCRELILGSDALVEGFRPGVLERLGLRVEELSESNPALVIVSISGFGQDGPYRDRPAHDLSFEGLAGLISRGDPPVAPSISLADLSAGSFAALAVLAGLTARTTTGRGGRWDVSMLDSLLSLQTVALSLAANARPAEPIPPSPAYGCFRTSDDQWMTLSIAFEDHFWTELCSVLDLPGFAVLGSLERADRHAELRGAIAQRIDTGTAEHWAEKFTALGVPFGPINTVHETLTDPHVAAREVLVPLPDDSLAIRQPLVVDGLRLGPRRGVPRLGEHTAEVLRATHPTSTSPVAAHHHSER